MRKVLYLFGILTDADIEWMVRLGMPRRIVDGEVLIREGQHVKSLILLLEGELLVTADETREIAQLGIGEIVGEVSLVDSAPASATVTARGDGFALFIDRATMLEKLAADVGFSARFYRALAMFLADRLRTMLPSKAARLADEAVVLRDELDVGILDHVSSAGERFNRMQKMLQHRP